MNPPLPTPRDLPTGIDRCADALVATTDVIVLAGGEGARRLWSAASAHAPSVNGAVEAVHAGEDAGAVALGHAAAGARVALLASGPDWTPRVLRGLREMARLGLSAQVVVPAHGEETGEDLPADDLSDAMRLLDAPVCVGVVSSAREIGAATASMSLHARAIGRPCALLYPLRGVGLARVSVGDATGFDVGSAVTLLGGHEAPTVVVSAGEALAPVLARAEAAGAGPVRGVQIHRLRPGLSPALAEALRGASRVYVIEAMPGALGDDGWLTLIAHHAMRGDARVIPLPRVSDEALASLEDPGARDLTLMPMALRRRLDLAGVKLPLASWQSLELVTRAALTRFPVELASDVDDLAAAVRGLAAALSLPVSDAPRALRPWDDPAALQAIRARAAALPASVDAVAWAALSEPARFVLAHLASPGRELGRFAAALRVTGLGSR